MQVRNSFESVVVVDGEKEENRGVVTRANIHVNPQGSIILPGDGMSPATNTHLVLITGQGREYRRSLVQEKG